MDGKNIELIKDQILEISIFIFLWLATDYKFKGNTQKIACSYEHLAESVTVGKQILIADGSIIVQILEKSQDLVKLYSLTLEIN